MSELKIVDVFFCVCRFVLSVLMFRQIAENLLHSLRFYDSQSYAKMGIERRSNSSKKT